MINIELFDRIEIENDSNAILNEIIILSNKGVFNDETLLSLFYHLLIRDNDLVGSIKIHLLSLNRKNVSEFVQKLIEVLSGTENSINIFYKLFHNIELTNDEIQLIVNKSLDLKKNSLELTSYLVLIKHFGLSLKNITYLSAKMAESGTIFDYRNYANFKNQKVIRRYPTGGVSEKIALILPSLLKCLSKDYPLISPFLIAKTLSFTGGTWDKLKSIPEFHFPKAGKETIDILSNSNVCMTVTKDDFNPSDRNLYQLRSITNTVESNPLIISSIASKQIANPVDLLLLDVRYGPHSFIKSYKNAEKIFDSIKQLLEEYEIKTIAEFTNSNIFLGSTIGNYLELIEAICIMKKQNHFDGLTFDKNRMELQKQLVIRMGSKMISEIFNIDYKQIKLKCEKYFSDKSIFPEFLDLLEDHNVSLSTRNKFKSNILLNSFCNLRKFTIHSPKSGIIEEIYQKKIGYFVNFELNDGANSLRNDINFYNGCIIHVSEHDRVEKNEILATIFSSEEINTKDLVNTFFNLV